MKQMKQMKQQRQVLSAMSRVLVAGVRAMGVGVMGVRLMGVGVVGLVGLAGLAGCENDPSDDTTGTVDLDTLAEGEVPANEAALNQYLREKGYADFACETGVFESGVHSRVRTCVNPALEASLKAGNSEHPVGAAAVKELYEGDGETLKGWAVEVKITSDNGDNNWWWYEVFSTEADAAPAAVGFAEDVCINCHKASARDFVLVPYPLR